MPAWSWLEYLSWRVFRLFRALGLTRVVHLFTRTQLFPECFKGFEKLPAVQSVFGDKTEEILKSLKVEFIWFGYMGVDDNDGHLMVNERYLNSGNKEDIYLDVIHELCHVKQHMDGRELFDPNYDYVDRPTEIEAYSYAVKEARRLGWSDERILQYLETEWMSDEDLRRLAKNVGVKF
jgi:hypothetical protein